MICVHVEVVGNTKIDVKIKKISNKKEKEDVSLMTTSSFFDFRRNLK